MKKSGILLLSFCFLLLMSCAKKEEVNPTSEPDIEVPTSPVTVEPGGDYVIKGSNFSETETYIVKFNEVKAEIVKIAKTELTVAIPEGITSGDITLEHNGKVKTVGSYTVSTEPKIETLASTATLKSGEDFTITGSNFIETETYSVAFNGVKAEIVSITKTELKVKVPSNITSGDITLEHDGKVFTVGSFKVASSSVYIFQYDSDVRKLAEINLETGELSYITESIDFGFNTRGIVYNKVNDEFIGFDFENYQKPFIIRIKPDGTTSGKVYIKDTFLNSGTGNFDDLVVDDNGKVYIFQYDSNVKKLAEINLETGDLTYITNSIDYGTNTRGMVYSKARNEFIGFDFDSNSKPFVIKIKPDGTTSEKVYIKDAFLSSGTGNFDDLVIDNNGKVYIFQYDSNVKKLAEINVDTGDLTYITGSIDYGTNTRGMVFSEINNEFIGFDFDTNFKAFFVRIKPDGTTSEKVYIKGTGGNFSDLVIREVQ
ncbi:hypothetical protein BKI52_10925 [marine bacterium AO1-C]|nr:hypothetical protein BKI52_10925 [marine bacterium AO1-C]